MAEEVAQKISAMKADGSSTRARMNAAGNGPFGVFQEFLVEAYEANPPPSKGGKGRWQKLVKDAQKDTVAALVRTKGGKTVGASEIKRAIYASESADAYKELVNMVPTSVDDLREIMVRVRPYVAKENADYVQKYGSQAQGFSSTEAEQTEVEEKEPERKDPVEQRQPDPYPAGYGEAAQERPREYVETKKEREARIKRETKKVQVVEEPVPERQGRSSRKKAGFAIKKGSGRLASRPLPKHLSKKDELLNAVREQWEVMQNNYGLVKGSQSEAGRLEAEKIGRQLFELETGIDLSNVSDADTTVIATLLEGASKGFQNLALSRKKREYLGGHLGGWKSLVRNVEPTDELDAIAKEHDMMFLVASTERDPVKRKAIIQRADRDMIRQIDRLVASTQLFGDADVKQSSEIIDLHLDAGKVKSAIKAKMTMDDYGVSPTDWTTAGVSKLDPDESIQRTQQLARDFSNYLVRAESEGKEQEEKGMERAVDFNEGYVDFYKRLAIQPHKFEPGYKQEEYEGLLPSFEPEEKKDEPQLAQGVSGLAPQVGIVPGETVIQQQGTKKVAMGLEDILSDLQKMNRQPVIGQAQAQDIFSLKPVTGERNMRPMLVKGDVAGIVKRKEDEEVENMNFYANWKFVSSGWGNGNQQALPDQIGMPFKNQLLRAQWRNQDYMFTDNFDVGARDWYKQTYMPHRRRDEIIHSKRIAHMYGIPMIRDNQTHQLPTRNGALPAGVGRPIHFAEETSNGWDIYTPNQRLNARSTRLFNGDVVDGRRV